MIENHVMSNQLDKWVRPFESNPWYPKRHNSNAVTPLPAELNSLVPQWSLFSFCRLPLYASNWLNKNTMSSFLNLRSPRIPIRYVRTIPRLLQRLNVLWWTCSSLDASLRVNNGEIFSAVNKLLCAIRVLSLSLVAVIYIWTLKYALYSYITLLTIYCQVMY